jgi:photosystem II stability/assembly factor-like uncharacterized protein
MPHPTVLVATWSDGLFALAAGARAHELPGESVRALASDGRGGSLAIVGGHTLRRRARDASWHTLSGGARDLACCMAAPDAVYVGTDDARMLRLAADGRLVDLPGFAAVPGRDTWYAGTAVVDGKVVGPPLGVRSLAATADGAVLLANVHVGGIPRSTDGGRTWQPTIAIDCDVHEVKAHPSRPDVVVAAAAIGLCISRDGGATWRVQGEGLHAPYCSAVGFAGDDVFVAAAAHHFAAQGALYRRALAREEAPCVVTGGLPRWLEGIADTGCIASSGSVVAVADRRSNLYVSTDAGRTWSRWAEDLPRASGVLLVGNS